MHTYMATRLNNNVNFLMIPPKKNDLKYYSI